MFVEITMKMKLNSKTNSPQAAGFGRYVLVAGMFLLALLLYIDRVCISAAKDHIIKDLDLNDKQMGVIFSMFALGYALLQVPSGILADRWGPRRMLAGIVSIWSVFTALTGMTFNYVSMVVTRFLFGAGEAGAFPGMSRAVFSWFPLKERGIITGINFSGSRLGGALAFPFVVWLINSFGWRESFFILGVIGLAWATLWYVAFRDTPEEHSLIGEDEKAYIMATRQQTSNEVEKLPASAVLKSRNMWLLMGQYFASNFTFFFALTWLFPYLKNKYGLDAQSAGFYTMAPFIFGAVGNWIAGYMVDRMYANGKWRQSRIWPACIGFGLAGFGLLASLYMDTALGAIIFLSIAVMGADMTLPPSWSTCVDIGKKNAGAISGTMNMAGNVGSFVTALAFPYLTGWLGSETPFFYVAAGLNLLAIVLWLYVDPQKPITRTDVEMSPLNL